MSKLIVSSRILDPRLALLLASLWMVAATAQTVSPPAKSTADRVLPLEVVVNGTKSGTWLLVEHAGALYAPRDAFDDWRVQLNPKAQSIQFKGRDYWPLASVPGYTSKVDFANQSLALQFSPQAFAETRLTSKSLKALAVTPALPSVFFNYDLNYQRSERRATPSVQNMGMLGEIGFSSNLGVLTSSTLGQNLIGNSADNPRRFLRLETTLTTDFPGKNKTLRLGDTTTRPGMLGSSVYYGGIRYGTNFALTPGFVSQPIPILTGTSSAPSTVSLYINDVLRQTSNVPTGPFAIDNIPALTGEGEARMVVRDLLGRETVITRSFFISSKLLAAGLDDWSVEAGGIRRDLGTANSSYGPAFGRGIWRHGHSDTLTLEGLAEATPRQHKLGLGLLSPLPGQWLGSAAVAASREQSLGAGAQWLLGIERQGLRSSIFAQAQGASENFRELGQDKAIKPVKLQLAANWTYASANLGSFGVGFASITPFDEPRIDTMTASYSMRVGEHGSLSLTASRSQGAFSGSSVGLSLLLPLQDNRRALTASATSTGKQTDFYLSAIQNPTRENSLGWRVLAGERQNRRHQEGGLNYLGRYGSVIGDVSASTDETALRLSASGGLVLADGHLFATRRANESFALAEVAGYGNVGVGLGSNVLARTDAGGVALIPYLVPYQSNSLRLAANDLPVSAEIDSIEQTVVPGWRSVVKVVFPVRSGRGALLKIKLDDGDAAPPGAIVQIEGDPREFYVARRGEAFVTGLQASNRLLLKWKERQCSFEVALPAEAPDQVPRVGPLLCEGVAR